MARIEPLRPLIRHSCVGWRWKLTGGLAISPISWAGLFSYHSTNAPLPVSAHSRIKSSTLHNALHSIPGSQLLVQDGSRWGRPCGERRDDNCPRVFDSSKQKLPFSILSRTKYLSFASSFWNSEISSSATRKVERLPDHFFSFVDEC